MPSEKVLICGAGVAGSVLAFWLAKHDYQVIVIERSRSDQKLGQGIEIEEPALTIVRAMGILDELEKRKTGEEGFELVDEHARCHGRFGVGDRVGFTGSLELMRGDLTEVLYKAADASSNVTYRFETTLESLTQTQHKATVELKDRRNQVSTTEEFDFVIGADGVNSRTRQLAMGTPEELDCLKPVGAHVAYFSIPKEERDWPYSKACQFPDRRIMWLRPIGKDSKLTSVYLIYLKDDVPALRSANAARDRTKQKEVFANLYSGLGWEAPRVTAQIKHTNNFYSDELTQVKLKKWSEGRVVLCGDSAWAPTPFTGEGNQMAIKGAWILAQEMSRNRSTLAFAKYEDRLRTHVDECQAIPLGGRAPYYFCPETRWGIAVFRRIFFVFSHFVRFLVWSRLMDTAAEKVPDHNIDLQMESSDVVETEKS